LRNDERTPLERRHGLAEALRWALHRAVELAEGACVVLAIDDLHRVDSPSRVALADAVRELAPAKVLVLGTHIPGFDPGWGADHPTRTLSGLDTSTVARLIQSSPSGERALPISQAGDLLPLQVDQLMRFYLEVGGVPPTRLGDLIAQRVDLLEPSARLALQALAVVGDQVAPRTLGELLPDPHEVELALDVLKHAGMITREQQSVSTAHPLLRDIVLTGIPATARRELHTKAMRVLQKLSTPLEARALHAYHSQDSFQALLLLEQVADRASTRGDTGAEVLALRRGLEIARQEISRGELDDPLQAVLIFGRKLGSALTRAGNLADAEGVLREALDIASPTGPERARVLAALEDVARARRGSP
jgi:serine/threonine-protein kinase